MQSQAIPQASQWLYGADRLQMREEEGATGKGDERQIAFTSGKGEEPANCVHQGLWWGQQHLNWHDISTWTGTIAAYEFTTFSISLRYVHVPTQFAVQWVTDKHTTTSHMQELLPLLRSHVTKLITQHKLDR